jgi:peptide/nickel transport system permease protein
MGTYVAKRLLQLIPILFGITVLSFAMMHLAGGDAVTAMIENQGMAVTQEVLDAKRHELGLDQPLHVQYLTWLGGLLTGDMGTSFVSGRDVAATFASQLPQTFLLTLS